MKNHFKKNNIKGENKSRSIKHITPILVGELSYQTLYVREKRVKEEGRSISEVELFGDISGNTFIHKYGGNLDEKVKIFHLSMYEITL